MEVQVRERGGVTIIGVNGRLDSNTSQAFEEKILEVIGEGANRIVLDFGGLDYISSAGLRVLLKSTKELKRKNGRMVLCSVKDYIREVFDLSGFIAFLQIHPSLEDSLSAF
jgi:anti-sigma B factor antagonist